MTIRVYPSVLPGEPLETHEADGVTIEQWLADTVKGYEHCGEPPITVAINGKLVPPERWADTVMRDADDVDMRPQPKDPVTIAYAVVAAVVAVVATTLLKPSLPSQANNGGAKGGKLAMSDAEGNVAKPGEVIPELAGRQKRFPDYLTQARRKFTAPKEQQLDMLLCLGRGEYEIEADTLSVGNTPFDQLPGVEYEVFKPGESTSGNKAFRNWYNCPEVGQSVGGSGIKLRSTRDIDTEWDATLTLSGDTITGDNQPSGWSSGTEINVSFEHEVVVGTSGGESTFEFNIRYLRVEPLLEITIKGIPGYDDKRLRIVTGDNGVYTLQDYANGWQTITDAPEGSYTVEVYEYEKTASRFRVTDASLGLTVIPYRDGAPHSGWVGFPSSASGAKATLDTGEKIGIWTLPFVACPKGETTTRIEVDIFAPQGLGFVDDNGDIDKRSASIQIRYRPVGSSAAWTTETRAISGATRDQLGWTFQFALSSEMRPEVQVRREHSESNDVKRMDELEWYGLKAQLPAAVYYDNMTTIAVSIKGSDVISSQTENKVSLVATRKLPELNKDGTWTAPKATRSIAAWFAHVATSGGYDYADLDLDELMRLDDKWSSRGDTFDFIEADESTVKECMNRCLRAGMSELTINEGMIRPVRDEPRTTFEQMYTPQNMTKPLSRSVEAPRPDDADGVDVEYISSDTWSKETVECRLPGDQGIKSEKLRIDGVTGRTRAWRIGMRRRRELKYRRWEYSFSTELDALNSSYMSYCALGDDVPGYGQSSLVESASGGVLNVTEPMDWTGSNHVAAWRRPDGTLAGPFPATRGGDDYQIEVSGTGGEPMPTDGMEDQQEPAHVLFGTQERWSHGVLITDISPQGFESVSVKAIGYDERIYADDNNAPS